jgi:hypothetical protein
VALRLDDAETQVRKRSRHQGDTVRLTQVSLRIDLHIAYRQLRSWLQEPAPELYLLTSSTLPVTAGAAVTLATVSATHERTYRVDRMLSDSSWRSMERADPLTPNAHQLGTYTFREEGGSIVFGPDGTFAGSVRVLYYATPATLTADADLFAVPVQLEQPLIFLTCALVALDDGDGASGAKGWTDMADALLKLAAPQLRRRHGIHPQNAGLRKVRGY